MSGHKAKLKNRRSGERKAVELPGTLIFEDGAEPCTIFDISPRGAKVSACHRVPLDRPIRLKLTEHGEFIGRIVWRNGDRMGLEFLHLGDGISYPSDLTGSDIHLVS
ncbi:MAG: PilZ domain-containing protein [Kiloniellales bacterium]